jgi:ketosteroid isomerase-like protein
MTMTSTLEIEARATGGVDAQTLRAIETLHHRWNDALQRKDVDAAIALYAPDTVLESPLVRHILKSGEGVVRGREHLRAFVQQVFARTPASRAVYRTGFFTDGRTVTWEYPRQTPDGEQMDFVEVMEIENGLIARHRVYWGWFGVKVIEEDRYWR